MSEEKRTVGEEVEKTVEDLKKQIEQIHREADEASENQNDETRMKIEAAARKAIDTLNQSIDQLKLAAAQVQDSEAYRKTMAQIRQAADRAYSEGQRMIRQIQQDPKWNRAVEDLKSTFNDVSNRVKSGIDELKENEALMDKVDQLKAGTDKLVGKGRDAMRDFTSRPEVQKNIDKAKDVTIDVAEKTVDALKNWLRPQTRTEEHSDGKEEENETRNDL